jgi:hypothetical protein
VRLSQLRTSATNWPIVPAPDCRWWAWSSRWNENWQGKPTYSEKTCPNSTSSTTNPTWPDLGSNPGCRCGKPATNRLSFGTANLTTRWSRVVSGKAWERTRSTHFMGSLGEPQGESGYEGEKEISAPAGNKLPFPGYLARSLVTMPTELFRLQI